MQQRSRRYAELLPVLFEYKRSVYVLEQPFCVPGTGSPEHRRVYLCQAYKGLHHAQVDFH